MKKILFIIFLIPFALSSQKHSYPLNRGWEYSKAGANEWKKAKVPGSIQQYLIDEGVLPNPFWGANEKLVQWAENEDWNMRNIFNIDKEQLESEDAILRFEGLDTFADIYLNGAHILKADNMFVGYDIPVREFLKEGENRLYIRFNSPIKQLMPQRESTGFEYPAGNDHREEKVSIYARKAPYHFGWDWGMRLVQMGIWRPVHLTFYDKLRITNSHITHQELTKEKAIISNKIEITGISDIPLTVTINTSYSLNGKEVASSLLKAVIEKGLNPIDIQTEIYNPQLWMPVGMGKQNLYNCNISISHNDTIICSKDEKIGLRNIRVVHKDDDKGKSFFFEVNGHPLFAKGANYIPGDIINTKQDKAYYDTLFDNIVGANMNMIRVWGGGFYEDDYFYRKADELGILIWQDFMFACVPYPSDNAFMENVEKEAEYNIKRLRNHTSIAIWCGNNEVEEGLKYWGWQRQYPEEVMTDFNKGYDKLFRGLLPRKVKELDSDRYYLHSSPDTANWGRKNSLAFGDSHYWGVWYGREPFESFDANIPRFMSEFGIQSFPEMKTILSFASKKDFALDSEVMTTHQKSTIGNDAIKKYIETYYRSPNNFDDFVYLSLLMQGEGMRRGMDAHRRNRPYCMGSLYWQLNDSWPVVSWAGIDYWGNWKALHYQAKRAFEPIAIHTYRDNENIDFYTFSDILKDINNLTLSAELISFDGKKIKQFNSKVDIKANSTNKVFSLNLDSNFRDEEQRNCFLKVKLTDLAGKIVAHQVYLFKWAKELDLPKTEIKQKLKREDGKYTLILSSKKFAKDIFIEIPIQGVKFSDNFFYLLPGEKRKIEITSPKLKSSDNIEIKIRHLRETY